MPAHYRPFSFCRNYSKIKHLRQTDVQCGDRPVEMPGEIEAVNLEATGLFPGALIFIYGGFTGQYGRGIDFPGVEKIGDQFKGTFQLL